MSFRLALQFEMQTIYLMGRDVWGNELSQTKYLLECQSSEKYKKGTWYCLEMNGAVVSSLILYQNHFGLKNSFAGIGSVATSPGERNKGFASYLVAKCIEKLSGENYSGAYLFSETESTLYERCGFSALPETEGLMFMGINGGAHESAPGYF